MSCLLLPIPVIGLPHLMFMLSGLHCVNNFCTCPRKIYFVPLCHVDSCFMTFMDMIWCTRHVSKVELINITLKIFPLYSASK